MGSRRSTTWKVLGRAPGATPGSRLSRLTGRTHQLRVHCAEMGWPIVGDNIYGSAPRVGGPPLHLHAREVVVPIFKNKPPVTITAPVPAHMRELLRRAAGSDQRQLSKARAESARAAARSVAALAAKADPG